ncbi:hypothetical protein ES702_05049 [subsurface metagenome]
MFRTTQQAVDYGLNCDFFQKGRLTGLRQIFNTQCGAAIDRGQYDLASMFATQAQFCREALESDKIVKQIFGMKSYELKAILNAAG